MGTTLHTLKGPRGATRNRKRIGRGPGSGTGEQSGKGVKGQKARTGHHGARFGFEGGQMPMQRRLPKVGFRSKIGHEVSEVLLYQLDSIKGDVVDFATLQAAGLIATRAIRAKIVKKGEIKRAVKLKGVAVTAGAKAAIEAAGGSIE